MSRDRDTKKNLANITKIKQRVNLRLQIQSYLILKKCKYNIETSLPTLRVQRTSLLKIQSNKRYLKCESITLNRSKHIHPINRLILEKIKRVFR